MNYKQLGVIIAAVSSTIAGHGLVVSYGVRRQEAILREMRATLDPVRADAERANRRIDVHLAWHSDAKQKEAVP